MSSFTEPLTVTKVEYRIWKTAKPFIYYVGEENSDEAIEVPEGFVTDFASVPRIFWILIPPDGQYTQAAVLHDYTYFIKYAIRKRCDKIFLEAMAVLKVGWFKRRIMYRAVRMFAWLGWNKHRKRNND